MPVRTQLRGLPAVAFMLIVGTLACQPVVANVRLPKLLADHMVWQRDVPTHVWGWADPGETVAVQFAGQRQQTKADQAGCWRVRLAPLTAGGPYSMDIRGTNQLTLRDVLVGDVWVCSGQSNMEWALRDTDGGQQAVVGATNPQIRLFTTSHQLSTTPLPDLRDGNWVVCSPASAADFSAVAYYFGKEIQSTTNVPVGLVLSAWGGTTIEPWMRAEALRPVEGFADVLDQLPTLDIAKNLDEGNRAFDAWKATIPKLDQGLTNGTAIWADPAHPATDWGTMNLPQPWDFAGFQRVDGAVWFRRTVTLPATVTQRGATIELGPIDEADQVWVNGHKIGETNSGNVPNRSYMVPASTLRAGTNVLVVRVEDYGGRGGIYGRPEQMNLTSGNVQISLAGPWQVKIGTPHLPPLPRRLGPNSKPTLLYNAMIHPLLPLQLKGVLWYQGESNAGRAAQYQTLFPLLISDWRSAWQTADGQPGNFPFLFVQIAAFEPTDSVPTRSPRAELREAQTLALRLPNTAMAVTIDIGSTNDIHPRNKQAVGHRLALAARKVAYGEDLVHAGPYYQSMTVAGNTIRLAFANTGTGLMVRGPGLREFAIAGPDRRFVRATAVLAGNTVVVSHPNVPNPVAVRYAWANNPAEANLFNREGLPASPFRTDDWIDK